MSRKSKRRQQRDTPSIASPLLLSRLIKPAPSPLKLIEDRRTHHPGGHKSARSLHTAHHTLVVKKPKPKVIRGPHGKPMKSAKKFNPLRPFSTLPVPVAFKEAKRVVVCLKRKIRKEVIFAKKLTRKGKGSRRHRNQWSNIQC